MYLIRINAVRRRTSWHSLFRQKTGKTFLSLKMDTMHKPLNHNSNNLSPLISNLSDCISFRDGMVMTSDFEKLEKSVFKSWRHALHVGVKKNNNKMETILVTQTSPVGVELFSCLKASSCCKIFAQLQARCERTCSISTKLRHYSEHNKDNMLIYVPQQDTGQHHGGRWARPSAVRRSRPLSQCSTNLGIFVLSRKPPCDRVRETRNSKRNLKLPTIKQSYAFMFTDASLWNRLPEEFERLLFLDVFRKQM